MSGASKILKQAVVFGVVLAFSVSVRADYPADRKAAMELVQAGKNEEALSAFTKLSQSAVEEAQKADALEQAAMCASRLKKYDQAIELAGKIPALPMSKAVQMKIMMDNGKGAELLAKFKDENFADWPSKAAGDAYYCRGIAYFQTKDGKCAEADLKNALTKLAPGYTVDEARLKLAENYKNNLNDDQQALAAYRELIEKATDSFGWIRLGSIATASEILRKQGKYDEAFQILGKAQVDGLNSYWKIAILGAYGETLAAQGKKTEAAAKFKEALAVKGITDEHKPAYEKRLAELQADGK